MMCMMGPFGELFKGVGSLVGATGNLVGGAAGGAAKGVNALGDVVSGEAFKPKLHRVEGAFGHGLMKAAQEAKKQEEMRKRKEEEEEERMRRRREKGGKMKAFTALGDMLKSKVK